jgi:ferredoxin
VASGEEGAVQVVVDYDKCSGLGLCESVAPAFFEVADDGSLVLLRADVAPEDVDVLREAVRGCPTGALSLVTESPVAEPLAEPGT